MSNEQWAIGKGQSAIGNANLTLQGGGMQLIADRRAQSRYWPLAIGCWLNLTLGGGGNTAWRF